MREITKIRIKGMLAVGVFMIATGCAERINAPTPTPSGTPTTSTPMPARFTTTDQLRETLERTTSIRCTSYEPVSNPTGAIERASCTDDIVLSIHTSRDSALLSVTDVALTVSGVLEDTSAHAFGDTWSVNCGTNARLAQEVADALNGDTYVLS